MNDKNIKEKQLFLVGIIIFMITCILSIVNRCQMSTFVRMAFMISNYLIITLVVIITVLFIEKRNFNSLGFTKSKIVKQLFIGFSIFFILSLATIVPLIIGINKISVLNFKPKNITILLFFMIYDIICVGFGEEIIFRGYFLSRMKEVANSKVLAIFLSSIFFGIWHFPFNLDIFQVITASIIGIIFAFLKTKLKNCSTLSLSIAHGLNDAFIILLGWFLL